MLEFIIGTRVTGRLHDLSIYNTIYNPRNQILNTSEAEIFSESHLNEFENKPGSDLIIS